MRGSYSARWRHLWRAATALTGAFAVWSVMAPAADASWSPVSTVSPAGWMGQDSPTVAVDRQGDTLLVWAACQSSASGCLFQVQARIKPHDGPLGPVKTLSKLGPSAAWPQVASGDTGGSAVVWSDDSAQVLGRRISATGTAGALRALSPGSVQANTPAVVAAPGGNALAVWPQERNGGWSIAARYFHPDGSLGPVLALGPATADMPGVAIDRSGTAVVAWPSPDGRVVARRVTTAHVSALKQIMPAVSGIGYGMVSVSDDRDGDAVVCFLRSVNSGNGGPSHVWARRWSQSGTVGGVLHLSAASSNVTFYHAQASDLAGDSMVVWSQTAGSATSVFGRRIASTGALGPIRSLGAGDRPQIAVDDNGDGLAVWQAAGSVAGTSKVVGRRFSPSGVFGPSVVLSTDGRVVRAAASPAARFSVIWQQSSAPYRIRARFGP